MNIEIDIGTLGMYDSEPINCPEEIIKRGCENLSKLIS
jgi:hypothetical protein